MVVVFLKLLGTVLYCIRKYMDLSNITVENPVDKKLSQSYSSIAMIVHSLQSTIFPRAPSDVQLLHQRKECLNSRLQLRLLLSQHLNRRKLHWWNTIGISNQRHKCLQTWWYFYSNRIPLSSHVYTILGCKVYIMI